MRSKKLAFKIQQFEPIGLKREQFAVIASMVMLAAWIPNLVSIPPILHIVKIDIGSDQAKTDASPLLVEIFETGAVAANGKLVTLTQLAHLADGKTKKSVSVLLKPDPCARHDIVVLALVALKRAGPDKLAFAEPDYDIGFGKATGMPDVVHEGAATTNAVLDSRQSNLDVHSVFVGDCQRKAFPDRPPDDNG